MADFMFPPWIHAPESIAKSYDTGLELGSNIQNQRAQLQEKEASDALWASISQQRQNQENVYRQQQLGQEQQRLNQDEQLNQLKVQDAQRKFAAQQQYQQFVQGGGDPLEGIMKFFPGTDESMTGYGQLARQMQLSKLGGAQPEVVNYGGEQFLKHRNEAGGWSYTPLHQSQDSLGRFLKEESVRDLYKTAQENQKSFEAAFPSLYTQSILTKPPKERTEQDNAYLKRYQDAVQALKHDAWSIRKREHDLSPQDFPDPGPDPAAPEGTLPGAPGGVPAYDRSKIAPAPTSMASQLGAGMEKFARYTPAAIAVGLLAKSGILPYLRRSNLRIAIPGTQSQEDNSVQLPDSLSGTNAPTSEPEFIPTDIGPAPNYSR